MDPRVAEYVDLVYCSLVGLDFVILLPTFAWRMPLEQLIRSFVIGDLLLLRVELEAAT